MVPRRIVALLGVLALLAMACNTASTPAPPTGTAQASVPAATPTAPAATATAVPATATPVAPTPPPITPEPPVTAPPTETPAAAACAGQQIDFMLSFLANIQHAGFLIAAQQGYYEEEGLDVTIVPAGPGTDVTTAVADGTADLGQVDYVRLVDARIAQVPVKAVAQVYKDPFFFWYSSKDGGPATMADWDGARVGAIQVGDYPERDAMMLAAGVDPNTVTSVHQDFDGLLDPATMDIAEGVVFFHPALINLVGMPPFPDSYNVFRPAELEADFASQTVAGSEEYIAANGDAITCFIRASIRGWHAAFDDPQLAVDSTMAFVEEGSPITPEHQLAALPDVLAIVGSSGDDQTLLQPDPASYQSTLDQLVDVGYLEEGEAPDAATTYDSSFYDAAVAAP